MHGNSASATFTVYVKGADEQLADLLGAVTGVGPGASLAAKVKQVEAYLVDSDVPNACSTLRAFINQVKAQSDNSIPPSRAAALVAGAQQIRVVLGC